MLPIRGPVLVVVSYYDARPMAALDDLLRQLAALPSGWPFRIRVVVNQDGQAPTDGVATLAARHPGVEVLQRQNAGYNIGAWEHGWRTGPASEAYLFLQHECTLQGPGWLRPFVDSASGPGVGLVGERINPAWNATWAEVEQRFAGHALNDHHIDGEPAARLLVYRHFFAQHGIEVGDRADHLQALVLFARRATLEAIGGLPHGDSYGEAIAAEIAISKKVQSLGLSIREVGTRPFQFVAHPQWLDQARRAQVRGPARASPPRAPRRSLDRWLACVRAERQFDDRPWLVLGKGPTFSQLTDAQLGAHHTFGLNHVVRQVRLTIAHVIDLDVVLACADALRTNCEYLLMPRVPHVDSMPGKQALEDLFADVPVLDELDRAGRLVWYNISTARARAGSPVIQVEHFSSEAAFEILGRMGIRTVRSLGVDGGRQYSRAFEDLDDTTRLQNGKLVFDQQFERIAAIAARYGIDHAPLAQPLRVCIGGDERLLLAQKVLEYTLRKHASVPLEFAAVAGRAQAPPESIYFDAAAVARGDVAELRDGPSTGPPPWLIDVGAAEPWRAPHDDDAWLDTFAEAVNAGVVRPALVRRAIARGHVSTRLLRLPPPPLAAAGTDADRLEHRARCMTRELANMRQSLTFRVGRLFVAPVQALIQHLRR